jgi:hypothetical protein
MSTRQLHLRGDSAPYASDSVTNITGIYGNALKVFSAHFCFMGLKNPDVFMLPPDVSLRGVALARRSNLNF